MTNVFFRLQNPNDATGNERETPVSIHVNYYHKGLRIELATGEKVIPGKWTGSRVKGVKDSAIINAHLAKIEERLLNLWRDHKGASKDELKNLVRQVVKGESEGTEKKSVLQAVHLYIVQYAKEKAQDSQSKPKALLKRLTEYSQSHKLTFESMDFNFYDSFKTFLYGIPNPNYPDHHLEYDSLNGVYHVCSGAGTIPVGLFDDIVYDYFIRLKAFCKWAEKRGYPVHPSYKEWQIIKREYEPITLSLDELKNLELMQCTPSMVIEDIDPKCTNPAREAKRKSDSINLAKDYFSLECRTSQRISDLRRFNKSDIAGDRWAFTQRKGNRLLNKQIYLPLVGYAAPALLVLQKYDYELPKISEQNINYSIKDACRIAGITQVIFIERWAGNKKIRITGPKNEFISTHTGRRTFITIALQFLPPGVVMDITGIRSFKTLRRYKGQSEIGTIEAGFKKIEDNIALMRKAN